MKIKVRTVIEGFGKPEEILVKTFENLVSQIKKRDNLSLDKHYIEKPKKEDNGFFFGFVEVEISFSNFKDLIGFIVDFGPVNLEVLEPEKVNFGAFELEEAISIILGKFHDFDAKVRFLAIKLAELKKQK